MAKNIVYIGVFLSDDSRASLLSAFPPKHEKTLADHVTLKFKPKPEEAEALELGSFVTMKVVGYAEDEKGQAVVIELIDAGQDILTLTANANKILHITISVSAGTSPVYSNALLETGFEKISGPILIGSLDTFPRSV